MGSSRVGSSVDELSSLDPELRRSLGRQDMDGESNLELFRFERMRAARERRALLTGRLSIKQIAEIRRRMPPMPSH